MNRSYVIGGVLIGLLLVLGLGAAVYTGVGPAPGGSPEGTITDFPTATPQPTAESSSDSSVEIPSFAFTIDRVEECGRTCRTVTATLHNNQNETATGVTVFTRIFAGRNTTDADALVWEGKNEVGTIEPRGSHSTTRQVELSLQEGLKVERNDGWITIVTTVQSDSQTVTFTDSEQVA